MLRIVQPFYDNDVPTFLYDNDEEEVRHLCITEGNTTNRIVHRLVNSYTCPFCNNTLPDIYILAHKIGQPFVYKVLP